MFYAPRSTPLSILVELVVELRSAEMEEEPPFFSSMKFDVEISFANYLCSSRL
jgi:hypothetical protein